jgi:hypothetical protein
MNRSPKCLVPGVSTVINIPESVPGDEDTLLFGRVSLRTSNAVPKIPSFPMFSVLVFSRVITTWYLSGINCVVSRANDHRFMPSMPGETPIMPVRVSPANEVSFRVFGSIVKIRYWTAG